MSSDGGERAAIDALAALRERPKHAALMFDIDGTLAPIVSRPEEAAVPPRARELLRRLSAGYRLVACISGRRALEARALVGIDSIEYAGNHGLERLAPGAAEVEPLPGLSGLSRDLAAHEEAVRDFVQEALTPSLRELGVRIEDKRAIWSLHWRGSTDEEQARVRLEEVARAAADQGLAPHWGRKVLEIRPPLAIDKGTAVAALLRGVPIEAALYAGDDWTDLDAFRGLRELESSGALRTAVCVGVRSSEGPVEVEREADVLVDGPEGVQQLLESLLPAGR